MNRAIFLCMLSLLAGACSPMQFEFSGFRKADEPHSDSHPVTTSGKLTLQETSESRLRISSRSYLKSTLDEIYEPSVATATSNLIGDKAGQLGGASDPYQALDRPGFTQVQSIPSASSARSALIERVCDVIHQNDTAVLAAAAKVLGAPATAASLKLPTEQDLASAYSLYYPGKSPSEELLEDLSQIVVQARTLQPAPRETLLAPVEAWRFVFLTLCLSPEWQVP